MRACRDWKKVRQMDSPVAWVHTVGMNLARSHFRRKKAERRALERSASLRPAQVAEDEMAVAIRMAVSQLPSRQKHALILRYFADLHIDDVASAMDCSATTAKSLIRKGLDGLRQLEIATFEGASDAL